MAENKRINLDAIFKDAQLGLINKSISQTMTGLRTGHRRLLTPTSKDNHGYVFLTRPQINLSSPNIHRYRPFMPLLNLDKASMGAWIRGTLDPRWARFGDKAWRLNDPSGAGNEPTEGEPYASQVDTKSPFINIVSNNIVQVSGFPDIQMPVFTSDPNRVGGTFQMIDGIDNLHMPVDITLTIQDVIGDPVFNLFRVLSVYPGRVFSDTLMKYSDFISEDTIDYNIRLFRIIVGPDGETIRHIGSTLPGFVQGIATGFKFDYDLGIPYKEDALVNIRCMFAGVEYDDPVLIDDFNTTMRSTHFGMRPESKKGLIKIPRDYLEWFSYERVYPFIDIETYKLEWWIDSTTYLREIAARKTIYKS